MITGASASGLFKENSYLAVRVLVEILQLKIIDKMERTVQRQCKKTIFSPLTSCSCLWTNWECLSFTHVSDPCSD